MTRGPAKTCRNGHLRTEANTYRHPRTNRLTCRQCKQDRTVEHRVRAAEMFGSEARRVEEYLDACDAAELLPKAAREVMRAEALARYHAEME